MAELIVQSISQSGINPTFVAASAGGDTFKNNGKTSLHVKNGSASAITVTVDSIEQCSQGFNHDLTVSIPASEERIIGTFDMRRFNGANSQVSVSYSASATVTVAAIQI